MGGGRYYVFPFLIPALRDFVDVVLSIEGFL